MHKSRRFICIVLILCCVFMTGCEKVKVLTAEEEEIITLYAAKVVAKHNVRLSQGIVRYKGTVPEDDEDEDVDVDEDEPQESEEIEEEEEETDDTSSKPRTEDAASDEESSADPVTLTDAMNIPGVTFTYKGASVPQGLRLSDYYTLPDPDPGCEYVIVTYEIRNTTSDAIQLSIASVHPTFTVNIDGETASAGIVLEDDLSTYVGTIEAGGSEDLIILFEVSDEAAADLSSLSLSVDINGQKYPLILQ